MGEEGFLCHITPSTFLCFLQECNGSAFTVLGDLMKCGLTDSETCLKAVTLALFGGTTVSFVYTLHNNICIVAYLWYRY